MNGAKPARVLRPWSADEIGRIIELRGQGRTVDEISQILDRPAEAVYARCKRLIKDGAIPRTKAASWSNNDLKVLEDLSLSAEQAAAILGRTAAAVKTKRVKLKVLVRPPNPWTEDQDRRLIELRNSGMQFHEIAQELGRSESAISNRVSGLILQQMLSPLPKEERSRRGGRKFAQTREDRWSEVERDQLAALWGSGLSAAEIAEKICRSVSGIENELAKLRSAGRIPHLEQGEKALRSKRGMRRRSDELHEQALDVVRNVPKNKTSGYVIGVLFGDGFITITGDRGSIGLKSTNESFCRSFSEALEETFGLGTKLLSRLEQKGIGKYTYKDVRYYEAFLHNVYIASAIRKVFGLTDEQRWYADESMLGEYGVDFVDGVIQGFFDAEGSYMYRKGGGYYTTACSMNERGIRSIHRLLCLRGYPATISTDKRGQWKTGIHRQTHVLRFAREIGSRIDYKEEKMRISLSGGSF